MEVHTNGNKIITTKKIAFVGVLSAVYVILSFISIGTNDFKVSVETLAVLVGAIVLGPIEGCFVGIVGESVHQLLSYGIDATTVLWLIPYATEGLIVGILASKHRNPVSSKSMAAAVIIGEVVLFILVTPVNAVSAIIQGWGNWITILGGIPLRIGIMIIRIIIYIIVLPIIVRPLGRMMLQDKYSDNSSKPDDE